MYSNIKKEEQVKENFDLVPGLYHYKDFPNLVVFIYLVNIKENIASCIVVNDNTNNICYKCGHHDTEWTLDNLVKFNGVVELSNHKP